MSYVNYYIQPSPLGSGISWTSKWKSRWASTNQSTCLLALLSAYYHDPFSSHCLHSEKAYSETVIIWAFEKRLKRLDLFIFHISTEGWIPGSSTWGLTSELDSIFSTVQCQRYDDNGTHKPEGSANLSNNATFLSCIAAKIYYSHDV